MIEIVINWLQTQFTSNDVFAGLVGGSVVGSLLYATRALPGRLWTLCLLQFTAEVVIFNDDDAFEWVSLWLAKTPYAKRARRLRLSSTLWLDDGETKSTWSLSPGNGAHLLWHKGRPVWIERSTMEGGSGAGSKVKETINIRTIGRNPLPLRNLIVEAQGLQRRGDRVEVFHHVQFWRRAARKRPRALDSVILPTEQVRRIVDDAARFFGAEAWYVERGVPYRRGYLLAGPPGCGKTSLVLALAGHFDRPIYALNIGSLHSDDQLFSAIADVPAHALLLIEDIDATDAGRARKPARRQQPGPTPPNAPEAADSGDASGITMSGLLNALDGVASTDGRLLIMTTNHPEKLDPALVRPGRADMHETIGPLHHADARRLFLRFFPADAKAADALAERLPCPLPAAALQGAFLEHATDPWAAVEAVATARVRDAA